MDSHSNSCLEIDETNGYICWRVALALRIREVKLGEMPILQNMTTEAFEKWKNSNQV